MGTGTYPGSATTYATGDFNLAGNVDLVTANVVNDPTLKTGSISILLGSGTFPSAATLHAVGSRPAGVAIGDFN